MDLIKDNLVPSVDGFNGSIEAIVDSQDFLENLARTLEAPGAVIQPGEIPGKKVYAGTVNGNRFKLSRTGAFANPCCKDLVGYVEDKRSGSIVRYRLENRPMTSFFQTSGLVAIICIAIFSALAFVTSIKYIPPASLGMVALFAVGGPLITLIVFVLFLNLMEASGESDQEEMLDHIKKLAAGVRVSS